ncbi:hypothetical protein FNF29_01389 [Cafeteria roenbergensis]|nr:hypothetical protein FNF29_01389 [Cafeteria roenbergensis]KAA0171821.1 hypothetical protein FNF28_00457 [Cafeteria roenbergensis]|eukprot:KAA0155970.1 hypothetical protein FNF29_01389 [Cafeteria roenbergensis]
MAAAAAALVTAVPALAALVSGLLAAVGCAWVPAAVAAATAAGLLSAAAFTLLVPELGDDALMQAEAAILADTKSDWRHEWSEFEEDGLAWQVHSVRAEADAALPDDASAVHIVVVHGHSSGSALFQCVVDDVITGLGAPGVLHKGQRAVVHLLDMPGWGRSPAPPAFAALREQHAIVSASASMLRGWLRLRGLHGQGRVVLLGHSVGGLIALRYALRHPSDLRQLILADPAGLVPSAAHTVGWTLLMRFMPPQLVARTFGRIVFAPFMAFYGSTMEEDHRFPAYYYTLAYCTTTRGRADVIWASCVAHDWSLTRVRWRSPAVAELLEAEVPLSLVWGSSDQLFPATHAAMVHSLRPDADVYVIDEAGHNPAHNDSAATAAAIVDAVAAFNGERPHLGDVASDGGVDGAPGARGAWVKAMRAAGSGRCVGCRHRVRVEGHSWYCNCGKWTFESHSNREEHHRNQQALARFLTELHGTSDFDASKAGYLNLRPLSDPDSSAPRKLSEVSVGSVSDCDTSPVRAPVQGHVFLLSSSSPSP